MGYIKWLGTSVAITQDPEKSMAASTVSMSAVAKQAVWLPNATESNVKYECSDKK